MTCQETIPTHCLEVASIRVCVFWPLAKLTYPYQYADSETVDGREEVSGTGCANLCVPAGERVHNAAGRAAEGSFTTLGFGLFNKIIS